MIEKIPRGCVPGHLRSTLAGVLCLLLSGLVFAVPRGSPQTVSDRLSLSSPDIIFVEAPVTFFAPLLQRFPRGSRLVRLRAETNSKSPAILTPEFFAAADPQISFDGTLVLFSGQKDSKATWQVWEMQADGSNKRQITHCANNCLRAAYLPDDQVVFTTVERGKVHPASYLAVSRSDGSQAHRITFGPADFQVETVLRDGRVLVSAPWPLAASKGASASRRFYTVRPDGSGLDSFRCDHLKPVIQTEGEELDDGSLVFVESSGAGNAKGGALFTIRRGAVHATALGPSDMLYWSARRFTPDSLLVTKSRSSPPGLPARFDLFVFDLGNNSLGEPIYSNPHSSSVQAVPVTATPLPKKFWSTLSLTAKEGYFVCLNSRLSAGAPDGQISAPIAQVRVRALDPKTGLDHELGNAPVEEDGSFYVAVPADQPIRFELLDSTGRTIRAEQSWVWARPGEQRGCPGCHVDKALSPANRWPLTFKRTDTPFHLGNTADAAAHSPAPAARGANP